MRWHRPVRWVIGAGGIAFAVFLYLRFDRNAKPPAAPLPPAVPTGTAVVTKMSPGGSYARLKDGKEIGTLGYKTAQQFEDGRLSLEFPVFTTDRDGKPFVVQADHGDLKSSTGVMGADQLPEETHLTGHVVLREQDGMQITADEATYRDASAILEIPGAMKFSDGKVSGGGVGATYDRNAQLLTIRSEASVHMIGDSSGQGRLDAKSSSMLVNRSAHFVTLDGGATIARPNETLAATSAQMHLDPTNEGIQVMQLLQRASIVPAGGSKSPEMRGDDIMLEFLPDGRTIKRALLDRQASMILSGDGKKQIDGNKLDVQLAGDGQTVTSLSGSGAPLVVTLGATADTPQRTIKSRSMNSSGDERKGLTAAVFDTDVEFVESKPATRTSAAARRTVTSQRLTLSLNGNFADINDATFRGGSKFKDNDTSGEADVLVYQAKNGTLAMQPQPSGGRMRVETPRVTVTATQSLNIDLNKTVIDAKGGVQTRTKPDKTKGSTTSRGLFDESAEVTGVADALAYDDEKDRAVYTGHVRLSQGSGADESRVTADTVTVEDTTGDLSAKGNVITQLPIDTDKAAGKTTRQQGTASEFEYRDAQHRAVYAGTATKPAELTTADGLVKATRITLTLAADGRELQRMLAESSVQARVADTRTVRGDRLDYDVTEGTYLLTGKPAVAIQKEISKGAETCTATKSSTLRLVKDATGKSQPEAVDTNNSGNRLETLKNCDTWIIK